MSYLINCEYFNNLKKDGDIIRMNIMTEYIYLHTQLKKSKFFISISIPSQYEILCQNQNGFGQYHKNKFICHL